MNGPTEPDTGKYQISEPDPRFLDAVDEGSGSLVKSPQRPTLPGKDGLRE